MIQSVAAVLLAALLVLSRPAAAEDLVLFGAGSLRDAIGQVAAAYSAKTGASVKTVFGPSGLMRERIETGDKADLFTSADMGSPLALNASGKAGPVAMFTRNALCAWARPEVGMTTETVLDRLLDPAVRLGTSTPKADPSGDYTWRLFELAEQQRPGSYAVLDAKARKIVGNSTTPLPAGAGDPIVGAFRDGTIDVMLGYCTSARQRAGDIPGLAIVELPAPLRVGAEYGLAVIKDATPAASDLALFILSPDGQAILAKHGFLPVGLPGRAN